MQTSTGNWNSSDSITARRLILDAQAAHAAPYHQNYEIRGIVGPIPTELAQSYCDVHNRLAMEAQSVLRIPQPSDHPWGQPGCAAGALIG